MEENKIIEEAISLMQDELGTGFQITHQITRKNNGIEKRGFFIRHNEEIIAPVVYYDPKLKTAKEISDQVLVGLAFLEHDMVGQSLRSSLGDEMLNVGILRNKVLKTVIPCLVGYEANEKMLQNLVHRRFLDLAITYRCVLGQHEGAIATARMTEELIGDLEIDKTELHKAAMQNLMHKKVKCGYLDEDFKILQYVTTEDHTYGAALMLDSSLLDREAALAGGHIYVIPSSIHEFLISPYGYIDPDAMIEMIREINGCSYVVRKDEVLSNSLYEYSVSEGRLKIVE